MTDSPAGETPENASRRRVSPVLLSSGLALLSTLAALLVVEVGLRWMFPESDLYLVLPAEHEVRQQPLPQYMPGVEGTALYRTSSWGIRGEEFGPDDLEYRILAVGGSTTENLYLDQTETWTLVLGTLLGPTAAGRSTWTGDVGVSGRTARSHVLQLRYLLPQLPRIDAIVALVGINDLTRDLREGFDYGATTDLSDPAAEREQLSQAFYRVPGGTPGQSVLPQGEDVPLVKRTALFKLARSVKRSLAQSESGLAQDPLGEIFVTWRRHRAEAPHLVDSLPSLRRPLAEYRGYLEVMAAEARAHGTRLVLMTQPTLWRDDLDQDALDALWFGGMGDFQEVPGQDYYTPRVLELAMDAYNQTVMDVCADGLAECFDLASVIPKDLTVFFDDVHFTEFGSRLVAEELVRYFRSRPPYAEGS